MSNKGYWYCSHCRAEVDPVSVNYQEEHVACGANVQWIPGEAPKPEVIAKVDWKEFETIGFLTHWLNENKINVITAFQALHGSYRLIYSTGAEKPANQSLTEDIETLKAENSKMRNALEEVRQHCKAAGVPRFKEDWILIEIDKIATEALKTT